MIILIIFITLITILIASYINVPWIFILLIIFFYILIYVLLSREKDSAKRFVVKINNQENKQNFFFSDKDKSIFNQNTFPMIIVDKSYRITSSNVAFNSYVGKDANGMNLSLCLRSNELNDALSDALTNEKKSDINFIIYDKVHKYIQAQIFPLKIKKEIFALVMMIDETPQKIAEKLKSEFVSNVSHELKTPLTAIMGFIETINGPAKNDVEQKFSGMINALSYGATPHGGIAPGIDRIIMLLANEKNIREVTMFPMNQNAQDLMMNAPSNVSENQLKELNLSLKIKK